MKSLLYLTLGALLACPIFAHAQSTNAAPSGGPPPGGGQGGPGGGWHHKGFDFLTADQKAELKKDRDAALAANPDLGTQLKSLHDQMEQAHESGQPPDPSLFKQMKDLQDQLDQAMIKIDPAVSTVIDEIKAHHPHHPGGPGGGEGGSNGGTPPPPPADSGT